MAFINEEIFSKFRGSSVLITGGLGFIGSNLANFLVEKGADVTIVDSLVKTCGGNMFNVDSIKNRVTISNTDLRETKNIQKELSDKDFIFNLAGRSTHGSSMEDPILDNSINCLSHLSLLGAFRKADSDAKIIYSGTRTQYGRIEKNPVSENAPIKPTDFNGIHKHFSEMYHMLYHKTYGINVCSLRLTNTYGPRQVMKGHQLGVLPLFMKKAIDNQVITIHGDGNHIRDFNFVSDVIDALCIAAISSKSMGGVFNVGSGNPTTLNDLAKTIIRICNSGEVEYKDMPRECQVTEIGNYTADISKIKKILKWEPLVGLEEGIKKTHEFFLKNKDFYW